MKKESTLDEVLKIAKEVIGKENEKALLDFPEMKEKVIDYHLREFLDHYGVEIAIAYNQYMNKKLGREYK